MLPQIELTKLTGYGTSNDVTASIKETGYGFILRYAVTLYIVFQCVPVCSSVFQCVSVHSTNNAQNSAQLCLTIFVLHAPAGVHKVINHETRIIKISIFKIG